MVAAPSQSNAVAEEDAEGAVKAIFEDIRETLRVPFVSLVFRLLAAYPDCLQLAWRQIKPNAQTAFFERQADELRRMAVEAISSFEAAPPAQQPEQVAVLKVFHYLLPKLLLTITALRSATKGQYPRLEELPMDEKRQITRGVPAQMPKLTFMDVENADEPIRDIFDSISQTFGSRWHTSNFRALANWPDYLSEAWRAVDQLRQTDGFDKACRNLRAAAGEAVLIMPFRIEINPHVLRQVGLGEGDIDAVQQILHEAYSLLPKLLLANSYLTVGIVGAQEASLSPYPVTAA